jgi:ribosome-binding protein aMBF1 (putative translation factor)
MEFQLHPLFSYPRPDRDRLPRKAESAIKELTDLTYRLNMQKARILLGQELFKKDQNNMMATRLSFGYSQQQLADLLGTDQPTIAKIESGVAHVFYSREDQA